MIARKLPRRQRRLVEAWAELHQEELLAIGRGCKRGVADPKLGTRRELINHYTGLMADIRNVDPRELRIPHSRRSGADPVKLHRQIARFGASAAGMPPLIVYEGTDGVLVIYNGVTRATRIAKLAPGTLVRVEVIGRLRRAYGPDPKLGDVLL